MTNEETLKQLHEQHGEVWSLETSQGLVAFRAPTEGEWSRFKSAIGDDKRKANADMMLTMDVVVHPAKEQFRAMLTKRPGLATKIAGLAAQVAMDEEIVDAKKFVRG